VGGNTERDRKRKELVHDQGNVCGRAVHWSGPGILQNDEGEGEDGAAEAATRTGGGQGGGRYMVPLVIPFSFFLSFPVFPSLLLSLFLFGGQARQG